MLLALALAQAQNLVLLLLCGVEAVEEQQHLALILASTCTCTWHTCLPVLSRRYPGAHLGHLSVPPQLEGRRSHAVVAGGLAPCMWRGSGSAAAGPARIRRGAPRIPGSAGLRAAHQVVGINSRSTAHNIVVSVTNAAAAAFTEMVIP